MQKSMFLTFRISFTSSLLAAKVPDITTGSDYSADLRTFDTRLKV